MGSEYLSDPLSFATAPLSDLVITSSIQHAPASATVHPGARTTSFLMPGDHATDARFNSGQTFTRWYFLSGVDVSGRSPIKTVVAFGDSITDGRGIATDGNDRLRDVLAQRRTASPVTAQLAW